MLEYNEGYITGMGYILLVNTEVHWLLRAFALSRSFVIGLSFTLRVGMPMCSRLFALMNDQTRFGFVLDCHQFGSLHRICMKLPHFSSVSSKFPKLFPMFVKSSLFSFFMAFVSSFLHSY